MLALAASYSLLSLRWPSPMTERRHRLDRYGRLRFSGAAPVRAGRRSGSRSKRQTSYSVMWPFEDRVFVRRAAFDWRTREHAVRRALLDAPATPGRSCLGSRLPPRRRLALSCASLAAWLGVAAWLAASTGAAGGAGRFSNGRRAGCRRTDAAGHAAKKALRALHIYARL